MSNKEDRALGEFLHAFEEKQKKENQRVSVEMRQIEKKRRLLMPIKDLLDKFTELGLIVSDSKIGMGGVPLNSTQKFVFYEGPSSPAWAPGVSLFFDHPAEVEIAIPNDIDVEKNGIVIIRTVSLHKDRFLFDKKFTTIDMAKDTLARFLGKNAIAITNNPRKANSSESSSQSEESKKVEISSGTSGANEVSDVEDFNKDGAHASGDSSSSAD